MFTNKERYEYEINWLKDYNISIADFLQFLVENNRTGLFFSHIAEIGKCDYTEYDVAVDWSIPLIMVKWFLNKTKKEF